MVLLRRILSLLLLALSGLPLLSALTVVSGDVNLPACCRKSGAHHCAMAGHSEGKLSGGVAADKTERCLWYPLGGETAPSAFVGLAAPDAGESLEMYAHPAGQPQAQARYRLSFSRGWQKRGPPMNFPQSAA